MTALRIDPDASTVWISGRSSLHPINSQAVGLTGSLEITFDADGVLDTSGPHALSVEFPVNRLRSSNPLEQRELHRRIDAKRFPVIRGDVLTIEHTETAGVYAVTGTVTFRGVAREHLGELTMEMMPDGSTRIAGTSTFDVRDFGMEPPKILMLKVEPLVGVQIEVVARPVA